MTPQQLVLGVVADLGLEILLGSIDDQIDRRHTTVFVADHGRDPAVSTIAKDWVRRNGGVAVIVDASGCSTLAARNRILTEASTRLEGPRWISFPDAQDRLDPDYLREAQAAGNQDSDAVALIADERTDVRADVRTSRRGTTAAARRAKAQISLLGDPESTPVTLRRTFLRWSPDGERWQFDERLDAGFADQKVILDVCSGHSEPRCILTGSSSYFTNRDDPSLGGRSGFAQPSRFNEVLKHGHLAVLEPHERRGLFAPEYVQVAVLRDLGWYFQADETPSARMNAEMHGVDNEFHKVVQRILELIDPEVIDSLDARLMPPDRRVVFRYGYSGQSWHDSEVTALERDGRKAMIKLSYRYTGTQPAEEFKLNGRTIEPRYSKSRAIVYAGRVLAFERILWVSDRGRLKLTLDDRTVPIGTQQEDRPRAAWSSHAILRAFAGQQSPKLASSPKALMHRIFAKVVRSWLLRYVAQLPAVRRRYSGSWVLMDRVDAGQDNAEHLFRFVSEHHPELRAWFAVRRGSRDWKRLKSEGVERILAYGSLTWILVCLNATHVVSSQAGPYVSAPSRLVEIRRPRWRFIFLQHGVIATDLHRWLNRRKFDLFVTTTYDEYAAIAGDCSPYRFTPHEVVRTGLPRHDRLWRMNSSNDHSNVTRLLVVPTWRENLLGPKVDESGARELRRDFEDSTYARAWLGLLRSDAVANFAAQHGLTLSFMPHPNMQPYLSDLALPESVEVLTYADNDVQEVLCSSSVVVTDFSSIVFDAAYIERPVIYYQFDQVEAFGGSHTVRQGYFDFGSDGFGPVCHDEASVVSELSKVASNGFEMEAVYQARVGEAFGDRDGDACARVVSAILELDRAYGADEAVTAVPLPPAPPNRPTPRPSGVTGRGPTDGSDGK